MSEHGTERPPTTLGYNIERRSARCTVLPRTQLAPPARVRFICSLALSYTIASATAVAQINDSTSLKEVEFSGLSQTDPGALGEKALSINSEQWKHAETEHFIYHFAHSYVATPIAVEAEFHYRVIARELERDQPVTDVKSHVYIFERPEDWQQFQGLGELETWTGGIQSGGSLFLLHDPKRRSGGGNVLGHEIVHLVIHRFYTDGIPCWLNEGLAQYISKSAHASYQRARGYLAKPHSGSVPMSKLIPMPELLRMTRAPNDRVEIFYDQSERLVRFLASTDKPSFLALLDALGHHQTFETALSRTYAGIFANVAALEEKFRDYACKDFGSTVQQAEN